jgi:putative ABC transport system ATP-binding protein
MSCNETIIIAVKNLTREISKNGNIIRTVDAITYQFNKGTIHNIVGPSGAGKSSLLRLLNRLDEPTGGEILFFDRPVSSYRPTELRKKVSMLFQIPYLFAGTVRDNLDYCCPGNQKPDPGMLLNRVGLKGNFLDKDAADLSVGEKQRVAIARSLILEPDVLLLDEPTSALDPSSSKKIEDLILTLAGQLCLTVIIVTHNPEQALRLGGKALLLADGKLIESGDAGDVLTSPTTELGRKYIHKELI